VLKRAAFFITAAGRSPGFRRQSVESVRRVLTKEAQPANAEQLTFAF